MYHHRRPSGAFRPPDASAAALGHNFALAAKIVGLTPQRAESGGKVSGKLVVGGIYLPWFISKGGMLCGFKLVDINAGLWDNDETNAMKQNDPNCKVGLFGGTFGSGEPWAILAIAWTLSTVFVIIAQKFKQHDNYECLRTTRRKRLKSIDGAKT